MKLIISHLFPGLLNANSNHGNVKALLNRCSRRGIDATVCRCTPDNKPDFFKTHILYIGGGTGSELRVACEMLRQMKHEISRYIEDGGVLLATCGGYEMLGRHFPLDKQKFEGIGVLDVYAERVEKRVAGDVVLKSPLFDVPIAAFENRAVTMRADKYKPFGKVLYSKDKRCKQEGIVYKNVIATHMQGPLLPKNPHLCDHIIQQAVRRDFKHYTISPLTGDAEMQANKFILDRYGIVC